MKEPGLKGSFQSLFHRKYIEKTAVNAFDLAIEAGECVGLIGPNGAGKTTLVKMLTGIIAPTSGEIAVLGYYPNRLENAFKKRFALVMGQKSQLFFELTPMDTFQLFRSLYEIPQAVYQRNMQELVDWFNMKDFLNVQVRTLSLGERMKMELIVALLHEPGVLFLDEPTIGLDAVAQRQIRTFLHTVNRERGVTILLTSHYMEDVRSLCPRSVVIGNGKKLYDGSTESLFDTYSTHRKITIQFEPETHLALPQNATLLEQSPDKTVFMLPRTQSAQTISELMHAHPLRDISIEEEDIGRIVERIYAGQEAKPC